jgi:hypothetical protein
VKLFYFTLRAKQNSFKHRAFAHELLLLFVADFSARPGGKISYNKGAQLMV